MKPLIEDDIVKAVSLTGSEKAGKKIAKSQVKSKKNSFRAGGNNSCIVLNDADLDTYLNVMVKARMQNTGQSCIAAKRFIVQEDIYDDFLKRFVHEIKELKSGDPSEDLLK